DRQHEYKGVEFEQTEHKVRSTSKAFERLMQELGAPQGPKVESDFTAPTYLDNLAQWQQALYLSAFFGAEMSKPAAQTRTNLYCPTISHNRIEEQKDAGRRFMEQIKQLLSNLDIETNTIETMESEANQDHDVIRYRIGIKNDSETLIRFFSTVGYRYNIEKQKKAIQAIQYLKKKEKAKKERLSIAKEAVQLYEDGTAPKTIKEEFDINDRFIERSIYSGRKTSTRPPADFPSFKEFCEQQPVHDNLTTTAVISDISYEQTSTVYDIGVKHEAHNFAANQFVVSNCGVRVIKTNLKADEVYDRAEQIANILYQKIPSGLGKGSIATMDQRSDLEPVLNHGLEWAMDEGYATQADLKHCEDEGKRTEADPSKISQKAKDRGKNQLGSLGSGNHFLEVQKVSEIYDTETAEAYGLEPDQVLIMVHCGSRGLGHQVCSDYLRKIENAHPEVMNDLPDRELAYAPAGSQLADDYYGAMNAAINYAWTNRQLITHRIRTSFERIFDRDWETMEMDLLYDVAHNIAKKEHHEVNGETKELYVHRKGATRAFPAGHSEVPAAYRDMGQPVIIPGSMGTSSYILSGGEQSLERSFGSTAHGAGRLMSRTQAKKDYRANQIKKNLERRKIIVKAQSNNTIEEEAPEVYKNADDVVNVSDALGLGNKVARMFPMVNIKG
ncbi:MAG: RtcB family protein, partial [Candidatus Nanohaloarchaeota archaeon QJJ-5]|nr:RtcB family protein [Candidatus Nanohaloarchaeota archaeon QJJ-5]